jgi:membrane-associated phospholipid phosphatase
MTTSDESSLRCSDGQAPFRGRRWLITAGAAFVVLIIAYILAVLTPAGQALENAALRGADQVNGDELSAASRRLNDITVWSLAAAVAIVAFVALVRRRVDLALAGVAVIVLGQVITQSLKRFVLPRPTLVETAGGYLHNSFPSGHTTIAMTVLFAAIIVVPYRWRGLALFFALGWALSIGAFTVTAKWHRFSDTLGADAIALMCACVATWWLGRRGAITSYAGPRHRGRVLLAAVLTATSAGLLVLGAILVVIPGLRGVDHSIPNETHDYTAYLGVHSLAAGFSALAALVFWGLWHRLEVTTFDSAER